MRVRAHGREVAWEPKYVADELAGTRQAVVARRQTATMRRAEAAAATDAAERHRLIREAAEADALGDLLDERVQQLAEADEARSLWFAHTAETRAAADRAEADLSSRRCTDVHDEPTVTAEVEQEPHPDAAETGVADIRDAVADEPAAEQRDEVRVPTADETADTIARAQRALLEIEQRQAVEQRHADEQALSPSSLAATSRTSPSSRRPTRPRRCSDDARRISRARGGGYRSGAGRCGARPTPASPRPRAASPPGFRARSAPAAGTAVFRQPGTPRRSAPDRRKRNAASPAPSPLPAAEERGHSRDSQPPAGLHHAEGRLAAVLVVLAFGSDPQPGEIDYNTTTQ
jgi:hypothetical protein